MAGEADESASEKNETTVRYSVLENSRQLFASKYMLYLPTEEELSRELKRACLKLRLTEGPAARGFKPAQAVPASAFSYGSRRKAGPGMPPGGAFPPPRGLYCCPALGG